MILKLTQRVLNGEKLAKDSRSGLKVTRCGDHLIIYRHGEMKLWVDTKHEYLIGFSVRTQAEVSAFNKILELVNISSRFLRSGRTVLLEHDNQFYRAEEYHEAHGPDSRSYSLARQGDPTP